MTEKKISAPLEEPFALIEGIAGGAEAEISAMAEEAARYARETASKAASRVAEIIGESERVADAQAAIIQKNAESRMALDRKKADLAMRDRLVREIEARAKRQLEARALEPGYRANVAGWIVEAAVGLGAQSALVNAGPAEWALIDDAMLREAEGTVLRLAGRRVSLRKADGPALAVRGVELVAADGRLSWDNRIATRFARAAGAIRDIAYSAAYDEESGGSAGRA